MVMDEDEGRLLERLLKDPNFERHSEPTLSPPQLLPGLCDDCYDAIGERRGDVRQAAAA